MNLLFKSLATLAITAGFFISGIVFNHSLATQAPVAGSFTPVGGQTYTLSGAGVNATQNTVQLTSFTTPDGRAITMTMVGQIGYGTLEPNTASKIEDITFTGITQNGNGTALLTGVSRGTDFISPYAASTTLAKAHAGGSYFILSNTAGFYGQQFAFVNNPSTISSTWTFSSTSFPVYDGNPTFGSNGLALVNKSYVDAQVSQGAATSTETNLGLVRLATNAQAAASTASSTSGAPLVLLSRYATSTPTPCCWSNVIPVTGALGTLNALFIATSSNYIWGGFNTYTGPNNIFTNLFATNASSTNATSTNLTVTGHVLGLTKKVGLSTTPVSVTLSTATTSVFNFTVEPGSLSTTNFIKATVYVRGFHMDTTQCGTLAIEAGYGFASSTALLNFTPAQVLNGAGTISVLLAATGATNTQNLTVLFSTAATSTPSNFFGYVPSTATTSVSQFQTTSLGVNSTLSQNFGLNVRLSANNASCWFQTDEATAELYQ